MHKDYRMWGCLGALWVISIAAWLFADEFTAVVSSCATFYATCVVAYVMYGDWRYCKHKDSE